MKNILITGASGFLGSHLIKTIQVHSSFKHYELILLTSKPIPGYKSIVHNGYAFSKEDFLKEGLEHIDIVIHAGAFTPKNVNEANNISNSNSNISSLQNLLIQLPNIPDKFIFLVRWMFIH